MTCNVRPVTENTIRRGNHSPSILTCCKSQHLSDWSCTMYPKRDAPNLNGLSSFPLFTCFFLGGCTLFSGKLMSLLSCGTTTEESLKCYRDPLRRFPSSQGMEYFQLSEMGVETHHCEQFFWLYSSLQLKHAILSNAFLSSTHSGVPRETPSLADDLFCVLLRPSSSTGPAAFGRSDAGSTTWAHWTIWRQRCSTGSIKREEMFSTPAFGKR